MGQKRFPLFLCSAEGTQPVRICIVEADNLLVGFNVPSILGVNDFHWSSANLFSELLHAQLGIPRLFASHIVERRGCGIPMQGPIYAAVLARKHGHHADVYFPRLSPSARTLEMLRQTMRRYDMVFVSALTNTTWAQKHIINLAKEEQKVAVATGASSRMYNSAFSLLQPGTIPASRHQSYNDDTVPYLGADYVLQHNHFNAFLELIDSFVRKKMPADDGPAIQGIGYRKADGAVVGLARLPEEKRREELPRITLDMRVISGFERLEAIHLTGSSQGCTRSCDFCQVCFFMKNGFTYLYGSGLLANLVALVKAGLRKPGRRFNLFHRPFKNLLFFTDDSPVLGGELEHRLPFDYPEFLKVLNRLELLLERHKRPISFTLRIPQSAVNYLNGEGGKEGRNPFLLSRLRRLGLALEVDDRVPENVTAPSPVVLHGRTIAELNSELQRILVTCVSDPRQRPFAPASQQGGTEVDIWGRQLNRSYIEFCKMLDSIEAFDQQYRCRQLLGIQLSVRAVNFLDEFDPYLLPRARRLGLEFVWIGFEDLLGEDNRSAVGRVKSTHKENLRAITVLKRSGIIVGSQLLCTMRGYRLGYAQEVALEARKLGVDMIQLFAEASFEGTEAACRNEEAGILLHQVAPVLFGNEWRDLGMLFYRGETVSATPLKASSLGMQLDIVKAILSFGRFSNHLKMSREWRKKGWRTTLNTMIASAALYAGVARDLLHWLRTVEIRDGKSYLRILAESDPRWRSEPETIQWVQELDLQRIVGHN